MHKDLFIADDEVLQDAAVMKTRMEESEATLAEMQTALDRLCTHAVTQGNTAENLKRVVDMVRLLRGRFQGLGERYDTLSTKFLDEIDYADKDLY